MDNAPVLSMPTNVDRLSDSVAAATAAAWQATTANIASRAASDSESPAVMLAQAESPAVMLAQAAMAEAATTKVLLHPLKHSPAVATPLSAMDRSRLDMFTPQNTVRAAVTMDDHAAVKAEFDRTPRGLAPVVEMLEKSVTVEHEEDGEQMADRVLQGDSDQEDVISIALRKAREDTDVYSDAVEDEEYGDFLELDDEAAI